MFDPDAPAVHPGLPAAPAIAAETATEAAPASGTADLAPTPIEGAGEPGDILYGGKAIARFLFGADGRKEQRRVFNLWSHYQHRAERVGFFKLKGAVCLSKSQWRAFQGR